MIIALPLAVGDAFWALTPFSTALLVRIFIGEKINLPTLIAIIISVGTMLVMSFFQRNEKTESSELQYQPYDYLVGVLFSALGVITWSLMQVTLRKTQ